MRRPETKQDPSSGRKIWALLIGALLALGACMIVLLACAVSMSAGAIRTDSATQVSAAACLIGCFLGGGFTCKRWRTRRLLGGTLTGLVVFVLLALISLAVGIGKFEVQALAEFAACILGGCLVGVVSAGGRKRRKKVRK